MDTRLWGLVLLGVVACTPSTEPTIDGSFVALTVSGSVRTVAGAPVNGARLEVVARSPGSCTGIFAEASAVSDATGAFSGTVANWNVPRDVCVWLAVVPPDGSGLAGDTVTVQPARLELTASVVTVDVTLPALPGS